MKVINSVFFFSLCLVGSNVLSMQSHINNLHATDIHRLNLEAQYAKTQQHYQQQSQDLAQREAQRQQQQEQQQQQQLLQQGRK